MEPIFQLQEAGTFELTFDARAELGVSGQIAYREVFLTGNYMLKLEGVQLSAGAASIANISDQAFSMLISSPQIINTTTPSNPGFIVTGSTVVPFYSALTAGATSVQNKLDIVRGEPLSHKVLCNFSGNKLGIMLSLAASTGFDISKGIVPYTRNFNNLWSSSDPVFLSLTFSYKKIF